jgi:hypothetical protein
MATRTVRTAAELQEATPHLIYEVDMTRAVANVLTMLPLAEGVNKNVYIEAFATHSRVLVHFMFPVESARLDDVLAEDYFDTPDAWNLVRGPMPPALERVRNRGGKEIVHLTYARSSVTDEEKKWNPAAIISALDKLLEVFADRATRLEATAKDQIGRPGIYGMMETGPTGPAV